jgi:hypothetical protein
MLNVHTLTQLRDLRLDGMVRAIEEQATSTAATALGFDERLSLLVQGGQAQGQHSLCGGHQLATQPLAGPIVGGRTGRR